MPFSQEAVDPLDLDDYIDFNQGHDSPASAAASSSSQIKAIATPKHATPKPARQSMMKPSSQANVFAGPSHQYDLHKQQTGLPLGGLASTIAANRQAGYQMQSFANNNFGLQNADEIFDFNAMPSQPPAFSAMIDMDMDFTSPVDGMMDAADGSDFVDPHSLNGPSPPPREVMRMYPGMHTQQAALAKQQQQLEIERQQLLRQQAQMAEQSRRSSSIATQKTNTSARSTDPMVEERISQLLNQMRQGSVGSQDGGATPLANSSGFSRSKKDEEDMDDDERLLASEEGKKLSSKERRQLRNKVSARAFRSRRKGKHFPCLKERNDLANTV